MQPRTGKKRISPVRAISSDKSNAAPLDQQSWILLVPLVFLSIRLNGKQPRVANMLVEDHLRPAAVKAGILSSHLDNHGRLVDDDPRRFGFHNLRHSLASFLIRIKTDPKTVQTLLRHSDVKVTLQFYTHAVSRDRMVAAGKMLTTILSHAPKQKRTESGLSRNREQDRPFAVIDIRISLFTRVSDADRQRTGAVPDNSNKFFFCPFRDIGIWRVVTRDGGEPLYGF
jgi:hypothetical protein